MQSLANGDIGKAIAYLSLVKQQLSISNEAGADTQTLELVLDDAIQSLENDDTAKATAYLSIVK